jgi:hypothetical protein
MGTNSAVLFNFLFLFKSTYLALNIIDGAGGVGGNYQAIDIAPVADAPGGAMCCNRRVPPPRVMLASFARSTFHGLAHPAVKVAGALLAGMGTSPLYVSYLAAGAGLLAVSFGCTLIRQKVLAENDPDNNCKDCIGAIATPIFYGAGVVCTAMFREQMYPWD